MSVKKKIDVLLVGVGGQGIILASDILGDAAIAEGYDVKKSDTLGMAQRGGSVVSHIRIAERVLSPLISEGEVDLLIAFEKLEAARWAHYLSHDGIAIINNHSIPPLSINLGVSKYPDDTVINKIFKHRTNKVFIVNGNEKVKALGDIRTLNIFMLGCMSSLVPISNSIWLDCLRHRLPSKVLDINLNVFQLGNKEISSVNIG